MSNQEQNRRNGDTSLAPPQRASRTFLKPDGWYFMTRERVDVGPFATEDLAQRGVADYAGFSMDADKVLYAERTDVVPDESGIHVSELAAAVPPGWLQGDVFDRRRGDDEPALQRSVRMFECRSGWYFATREGGSVGPFPTRADAERGVLDYVGQMMTRNAVKTGGEEG